MALITNRVSRILAFVLVSVQAVILPACVSVYDIPMAVVYRYQDLKSLELNWTEKGFYMVLYKPLANLTTPEGSYTGKLQVTFKLKQTAVVSLDEARQLIRQLYRDYYLLTRSEFRRKGVRDHRNRIEVHLTFLDEVDESMESTVIFSASMSGIRRTYEGIIDGKEIRAGMIREDVREELADLVDECNVNGSKMSDRGS